MTSSIASRLVSPARSELSLLRQPLQPGEWKVFAFLDEHLAPEWEIYVQPHLNGLKPDFVLLNPRVGVAVFEVKDWDLNALERWEEERTGRAPVLMGRKDGKEFSLERDNPVAKVIRYSEELRDLYCPRMGYHGGLKAITAGVVFPFADDAAVLQLFQRSRKYWNAKGIQYAISGGIALEQCDMSTIFPQGMCTESEIMNGSLAADLRLWLAEADAPRTQRTPLELDETQRRIATSRTVSGYRRIKGPAGSGKSIAIAARAAELIRDGQDVLVISFNITLLNYLTDTAVRHSPTARKHGTWLNFHGWCKRVCETTGNSDAWKALLRDRSSEFPDAEICHLINQIIDNDAEELVQRYDAVLADEGQDFRPEWWALLRKVCRRDGEMLLAADATQDVYGMAVAWTDKAMAGAGFTGEWTRLANSYRLPLRLIPFVRDFGMRYLPPTIADLPPTAQLELEITPCKLRWVQAKKGTVARTSAEEFLNLLRSDHVEGGDFSVSDVTVLVDSERLGYDIVSPIRKTNIKCIDTFAPDDRRKKVSFYNGDARVKVTTLQSFKGWESRALLVCVERGQTAQERALLYSGLTRLKSDSRGSYLTVVCSDASLTEYGKTWPDFVLQT